MDNFTYTHKNVNLNSSAVEEIYYNDFTAQLVVVVIGGSAYLYSLVPTSEFIAFNGSPSKGRFYATKIKRQFGPGQYLGYVNSEDDFFVDSSSLVTSGTISSPVPSSSKITTGSLSSDTVGTPKNLVYAENVTPKRSNYTVAFEFNGKVREHNLQANSLEEALLSVQTFAQMLDLNFKIKSVTVHFE